MRVVTSAGRAPIRPATGWRRVVSIASARVIAGRTVVSRRASLDVPGTGGPRRRRFGTQRLYHVQVYQSRRGNRRPFPLTPAQNGRNGEEQHHDSSLEPGGRQYGA
jgi:hypothetical protein